MPTDISLELRKLVAARAEYCCEYCRLPEQFALHKHEPDHIVPRQHGGQTNDENLAQACFRCNRFKGPNVGSYDPLTGKLAPFFNPRLQNWHEHFEWDGSIINPLTPEGRVTVKILRLNDEERLFERQLLLAAGLLS